jgi:isopentenyl-diphosphate delta-isomerase
MEETNIDTPLTFVGQFRYYASFANGLTEHELDHVFIGVWSELPTTFDPEEIETMKWVSLTTLQKNLDDQPFLYTPWLSQVLKIALPHRVLPKTP